MQTTDVTRSVANPDSALIPPRRPWYKRIVIWRQRLGKSECPYLVRWVLDLGLFSVRLHHWLGSDDARFFHDHPWWFVTLVLSGGYIDVSPAGEDKVKRFSVRYRPALHRHTVKVNPGGCWSMLLTGPETREWGFWVGRRFRHRNKYFYEYGHHPCEGAANADDARRETATAEEGR